MIQKGDIIFNLHAVIYFPSSVAYRVKVTFEGQDTAFIEKAYCSLLLKLSPDYILTIQSNYSLENDCKARYAATDTAHPNM